MPRPAEATNDLLTHAATNADWTQVVLNGGPPCFHIIDDGRFCLRAERWHDHRLVDHSFVSLKDMVTTLICRGGGDLISFPVPTPIQEMERRMLLATLKHCKGNQTQTAKALQLSTRTVYNRIEQYRCSECAHNPKSDVTGVCAITGELCPRHFCNLAHRYDKRAE